MDPSDTLRAIRNYCDWVIRPGCSVSERVRALEAIAAEFCDLDLFLQDKGNPLPEDWARPGARVEVLHVRDPDGYCEVDVYLDGVVARATEQSIDPGAGRTRSGWNEHLSEVEGDETLSPAFRAATLEALHSWENDPNIDEDE